MPTAGVTIRRLLPAPRARVFEAWTRPELMIRWFFPEEGWVVAATAELEVGGRYELVMKDTAGGTHLQFGEYREIVPDTRLVFTWNCPELNVVASVVTVDLLDHAEGTELILNHELPPEPAIREGHRRGWVGCLTSLEKMLRTHE